jgi:hypothetical protein
MQRLIRFLVVFLLAWSVQVVTNMTMRTDTTFDVRTCV